MLEELKKKSMKKAMRSIIVVVVIAIALIAVFAKEMFLFLKGAESFESLTNDELPGSYVKVSVWFSAGCYAEEYTTYSNSKKERKDWLYYAIQTEDLNPVYMGIRVPPKDEEKMSSIVDISIRMFNGDMPDNYDYEKVYTGTVLKMDDTQYKYFKNFFAEGEEAEAEFLKYSLPYFIKPGYLGNKPVYLVVGAEILGVLLLLYALLVFLRVRGGKYQKKLIKAIESEGPSAMGVAERDYTSAKEFAGNTKVGKIYTFFWNGKHCNAAKNSNLVWAYLHKTTHSTNGIKTGTTYEVMMYDKDKKAYRIPVSSEASATSILEHIATTMPNVVVGYDDEIARIFRKDFNGFLNIKYYQNQNQNSTIEESQEETASEDLFAQPAASEDPFAQTAASDDPFASYFEKNKDKNKKYD